jgi:hypothetical protein
MTKEFIWEVLEAYDEYSNGLNEDDFRIESKSDYHYYVYPMRFDNRVYFECVVGEECYWPLWAKEPRYSPASYLESFDIIIEGENYTIEELKKKLGDYNYFEDFDGTEGAKEV